MSIPWRRLLEATPWGHQPKYLVRDRDRVYGPAFAQQTKGLGIETLLTPFRSPRANAGVEEYLGRNER